MSARFACLAALLCVGCRSSEPWTFGLSRALYEDGGIAKGLDDDSGGMDAAAACVLLALPLVLDVLFLPVALPRDLAVHGPPGG